MIPVDLPLLPLGENQLLSLTAMLDTKLSAKASSRIESAVSRENVVKELFKQQQEIDDLTAENKRLHNELEGEKSCLCQCIRWHESYMVLHCLGRAGV